MSMSIKEGCPYCERPWAKEDAAAKRCCEEARIEEERAIKEEIKTGIKDGLSAKLREQKAELQETVVAPLRDQLASVKDSLEAEREKKWKKDELAERRAVARREAELKEAHEREVRRLNATVKAMGEELQKLKRRGATADELGAEGQKRVIERIRAVCPNDDCEETVRGRKGTDVFQRVRASDRRDCGLILWESKNDAGASFDSKWIDQARIDLHEQQAQYIVIVANAVPRRKAVVKADGGGVLVTTPDGVESLALVLHQLLVAQATKGLAHTGALAILTSGRFQRDVAAVVRDIDDDREALAKEQREHEKAWTSRRQRTIRIRERLVTLVDETVAALENDARPKRRAS